MSRDIIFNCSIGVRMKLVVDLDRSGGREERLMEESRRANDAKKIELISIEAILVFDW